MKIVIVDGVYGLKRDGCIVTVAAGEPPIEVPDAEAERLIQLKVAKAVLSDVATPVAPPADDGEGEDVDGDNQDAEDTQDGEEDDDDIPSYSADMTVAELKELMEFHGLPVKSNMSKAKMVEALDALFEVEDAPPECSAADPVL